MPAAGEGEGRVRQGDGGDEGDDEARRVDGGGARRGLPTSYGPTDGREPCLTCTSRLGVACKQGSGQGAPVFSSPSLPQRSRVPAKRLLFCLLPISVNQTNFHNFFISLNIFSQEGYFLTNLGESDTREVLRRFCSHKVKKYILGTKLLSQGKEQ
jgi:hypothetical protein